MRHHAKRGAITLILALIITVSPVNAPRAQATTYAIDLSTVSYRTNPRLPGVETAVIFGNRNAAGLYATHARLQAGARVPPHTHPNTLTTWVTSGTAYVGTGETYDERRLKAYPTGSFFVTPAGQPHFILAKDGPFSILDHGAGPSGFVLVDPN